MEPTGQSNISAWVNGAPVDQREFREAVHVVLATITNDPELRNAMVMKGGILLAI